MITKIWINTTQRFDALPRLASPRVSAPAAQVATRLRWRGRGHGGHGELRRTAGCLVVLLPQEALGGPFCPLGRVMVDELGM